MSRETVLDHESCELQHLKNERFLVSLMLAVTRQRPLSVRFRTAALQDAIKDIQNICPVIEFTLQTRKPNYLTEKNYNILNQGLQTFP